MNMYEPFFGLTGKPFRLSPDPSVVFRSDEHRRAMAFVKYGLRQGEGFVIVTGEPGAGKTVMVNEMVRRLDPAQVTTSRIDAAIGESASSVLRRIAMAFGEALADDADGATALARLEAFLHASHAAGRRAVVIVDEAQHLSAAALEDLRLLSNLQAEGRSMPIFLFGQASLRANLRRPALVTLQQRVVAACHLGAMSAEDTRGYIEYRLSLVGWNADPVIDEGAYDRIFEVTHGIARRINGLCDRLLLAAFLSEHHRIDAEDVDSVVADMAEEFGAEPAGSIAVPSEIDPDLLSRLASMEHRIEALEASYHDLRAWRTDPGAPGRQPAL